MRMFAWSVRCFFTVLVVISFSCNDRSPKTSHPATADTDTFQMQEADTATGIETIDSNLVPSKLVPHHIHLERGIDFDLSIPPGYNVSIAYENLHRLRFLTKSPDGKLFGTDMYNRDDN